MLLGFLLAVPVQAYVQASVARVFGDRPAFRRAFGDRLTMRRVGDLRRVLDPFGAVAALLGGLGWGVTPDIQLRSRGRLAIALLAGPIAVAALGVLAVLGFVLVGGPREVLPGSGPGTLLAGVSGSAAPLFFFGLALDAARDGGAGAGAAAAAAGLAVAGAGVDRVGRLAAGARVPGGEEPRGPGRCWCC